MIKVKTVARMAVLTALAVLLGYVEGLFPPPVAIPGIKLGLANVIIITVLYICGAKQAWTVTVMKVSLCALLFGSATSFLYSVCGAVLSLAVMTVAKRSKLFSIVGVSSLGGIFHNMGQLICAYFFIGKGALLHIPVLCLCGALCGVLTGLAAQIIIKRGRGIFAE